MDSHLLLASLQAQAPHPPLQTAGFGNIGLSLLSMFQVVRGGFAL